MPKSDLTLYAKWNAISYRVNFVGHSDMVLEYGSIIEYPSIEGYNITWYLMKIVKATFETVPDYNLTFYAKELTPLYYKQYQDGWEVTNPGTTSK